MSLLEMFGGERILQLLLVGGVLLGIRCMGSPRTAVRGNWLSTLCMAGFILMTMHLQGLLVSGWAWGALAAGSAAGLALGLRVRMIQMPEMVALLNGLGGAASAIVAWQEISTTAMPSVVAVRLAAGLGITVGAVTLGGSLVAAAKLARKISPRPLRIAGLTHVNAAASLLVLAGLVGICVFSGTPLTTILATLLALLALGAGTLIVMRVGGADMPVAISFLNSLSGVAAAFTGFALGHFILVAVGGIVGASGLMLTQIMCRAMRRNLGDILTGRTTSAGTPGTASPASAAKAPAKADEPPIGANKAQTRARRGLDEAADMLQNASHVILVPGYGMAVAQAQMQVKALFDWLEKAGKEVTFAIHPVAGRMPGHMHVLLAEVQIPYEKFVEMDAANPLFPSADAVVVVGANDVINPAANTAVGTPIYGMPVLDVAAARNIIVCNLNSEPGYAGVPNPLYEREDTILLFGDASKTLGDLTARLPR